MAKSALLKCTCEPASGVILTFRGYSLSTNPRSLLLVPKAHFPYCKYTIKV